MFNSKLTRICHSAQLRFVKQMQVSITYNFNNYLPLPGEEPRTWHDTQHILTWCPPTDYASISKYEITKFNSVCATVQGAIHNKPKPPDL